MKNAEILDFKTFNRTSMELKQLSKSKASCRGSATFNRTSMELKRDLSLPQAIVEFLLLIEPVWN